MLAQRRYETVKPIVRKPRRQRRKNLLRGLIGSQMACALILAVAVTFVFCVYVSAYARVTSSGYEKGRMLSHLKSVNMENESMRLTLETLQQPERIEAFAVENGMQQAGSRIAYIKPASHPSLARNIDDIGVR